MFNSNRLFGDDFENLWSSSVNCQAQDYLKDERSGGDILCFLCDLNDLLYAGNCTWGDNFPPIRYIFHFVTSHCENWHLSVKNWNFGFNIDKCYVLCLVLSTSTFIGLFILLNLIINVIIQQIFDFLTSREYWVTLYVIFTILIRLKILGIIHIDIEYIMLLLLLNCLLSWMIELYCDVNPPPPPTVQLVRKRCLRSGE